jgi:hypothetical protein
MTQPGQVNLTVINIIHVCKNVNTKGHNQVKLIHNHTTHIKTMKINAILILIMNIEL